MTIAINRERLAATFTQLCEISSPSRHEGKIAAYLKEKFTELGADDIYEDSSAATTGSETGNLIVRFDSNSDQEGFFLCCHMDTVGPCNNVQVQREGDIFTSKGDTVLGSDDKSGIAAILELLALIQENDSPHPPLEIVITTCEEIGLLGAKALEHDRLRSPYGYALDSSGIDHVIIGAPAANRIKIDIKGQAAHAGLCPEDGINALAIAARALNEVRIGRLDEESTCNFGLIEGGVATNIVPALVTIRGEVRSHSPAKLVEYTDEISRIFNKTAANWPIIRRNGDKRIPEVCLEVYDDYPALRLEESSPVLRRIKAAAAHLDKELDYVVAGGGSDANVFGGHDRPTAIIATGMDKVHTTSEQLDLRDLISLTELLVSLTLQPWRPGR